MLSAKQCELARIMTRTDTPDCQIVSEFNTVISIDTLSTIAECIDNLLKLHDMPFDVGFDIMAEDFALVAEQFEISPATLFCIYMDSKQQGINDILANATQRSGTACGGKGTAPEQNPRIKEM